MGRIAFGSLQTLEINFVITYPIIKSAGDAKIIKQFEVSMYIESSSTSNTSQGFPEVPPTSPL